LAWGMALFYVSGLLLIAKHGVGLCNVIWAN
jgi:hypothetical protein